MSARKILIIEDEEVLADNLKTYLERSSCIAQVASDGASAIAMMKSFTPECLVLDYRLPDMSGFDALDSLHHRRAGLPCVLITGHPTSEVYSGAASRGIDHILFKPFPLSELSGVILRVMSTLTDNNSELQSPLALPPLWRKERRKVQAAGFPMRLYDGTWVESERRHSARLNSAPLESSDGEQEEAPDESSCGLMPR